MTTPHEASGRDDFSLVLGGPLFQMMRRAHLSGYSLELCWRRVMVITLVAWLPLLVLSTVDGKLLGSDVAMAWLFDLAVHVRFLVAVPLLVGAELVVHQRIQIVVRQFLMPRVVPAEESERFHRAVASAMRLRNSVLAELVLVALVYCVGVLLIWLPQLTLHTTTWYATPTDTGAELLPAGYWYAFVSIPIFQFLLVRWYFRIFIWARLLWQVSRINLSLMPMHPDGVGGLGFLSQAAYAFIPLAVAHGALLSGMIASRIIHTGASLTGFRGEIAAVLIFVQCLVFLPLLVFSAQFARAKRAGQLEYGMLAEQYVTDFDAKWLRCGAPAGERLLGSSDVQSLADLSSSMEVVQGMRFAPVNRDAVLQLVAAVLLPVAPLLLSIMSIEEMVRMVFGALF